MKTSVYINQGLMMPYESIHIFERPAKYNLDFHRHEKIWHINFVTAGELKLYTKNECITIKKNQLFIIPGNIFHKIVSESGYTQLGVNILPCDDERGIYRMVSTFFSEFPTVIDLLPPALGFSECVELLKNPVLLNVVTYINMYEKTILEGLKSAIEGKKTFSSMLTKIFSENDPCLLTLSDICRMTSYSKTQVERLAKKELGCGIMMHLNDIKLNRICSLLRDTDMTISQIATETGMYDASHLTAFFKRKMGITPGKYRRK